MTRAAGVFGSDNRLIDPAFGNWLAGFIDGEGCFSIERDSSHQRERYLCRFLLELRDDDKSILEEVVKVTSIGKIKNRYRKEKNSATSIWLVKTKEDCFKLVQLLDCFSLRAKKKRDFEVWREAVMLWRTRKIKDSWECLALKKQELERIRRYAASQ